MSNFAVCHFAFGIAYRLAPKVAKCTLAIPNCIVKIINNDSLRVINHLKMNLDYLLNKPLWQMTGEEFIFLSKTVNFDNPGPPTQVNASPIMTTENVSARRYVYGLRGIAEIFGCSIPTANRIKKSGKIDRAIRQIGRKIIVDVDLALELAARKSGGRK